MADPKAISSVRVGGLQDALSRGEAALLHDEPPSRTPGFAADVSLEGGGVRELFRLCGRKRVADEEGLGERLARFELGGVPARPMAGMECELR